jgi:hypothetical protein
MKNPEMIKVTSFVLEKVVPMQTGFPEFTIFSSTQPVARSQ